MLSATCLDPSLYRTQISRAATECCRVARGRGIALPSASESSIIRPSSREQWDRLTDRLVASSAVPFSILVLPQVLQNTINMCSGQAASLSIISWEVSLIGVLRRCQKTLACTYLYLPACSYLPCGHAASTSYPPSFLIVTFEP